MDSEGRKIINFLGGVIEKTDGKKRIFKWSWFLMDTSKMPQ